METAERIVFILSIIAVGLLIMATAHIPGDNSGEEIDLEPVDNQVKAIVDNLENQYSTAGSILNRVDNMTVNVYLCEQLYENDPPRVTLNPVYLVNIVKRDNVWNVENVENFR